MNIAELGQALKAARIAKGFTLRQLDDISGVGFADISRLENGRMNSDFGIQKFMRLAEAVGLTLELKPEGFGYTLEDATRENEGSAFKF